MKKPLIIVSAGFCLLLAGIATMEGAIGGKFVASGVITVLYSFIYKALDD